MNTNRWKLLGALGALGLAVLACALPGTASPTPFVFPTPNLTLTAFFSQVTQPAPPPTVTPAEGIGGGLPVPTSTPFPTSIPPTAPPSPTSPPIVVATATAAVVYPTNTPSYAGPGMRSGPSFAATYLSTPPKIDGYVEEWTIPLYRAEAVVYGQSNWDNADDLSAAVFLGWDETYLYVGAKVHDDTYVQNATGAYLYQGDSLEILLDTDVSGDYYLASLSADDFQLGISPGNPAPNQNPEAYLWFPRSQEGRRSNVQIAATRSGSGYHIEAAIPWSVFGVTPTAGRHFGFVFSVSDNDLAGKNVQQSMVSLVSTRVLTAPTTWGDLTLVKP